MFLLFLFVPLLGFLMKTCDPLRCHLFPNSDNLQSDVWKLVHTIAMTGLLNPSQELTRRMETIC